MADTPPNDVVTVARADLVQALADLDAVYREHTAPSGREYGTAYRARLRAALEADHG